MTGNVQGDSPEAVAFALFELIQTTEAQTQNSRNPGAWFPSKEWVIRTYADCLSTVKNPHVYKTPT